MSSVDTGVDNVDGGASTALRLVVVLGQVRAGGLLGDTAKTPANVVSTDEPVRDRLMTTYQGAEDWVVS